MDHDPHFAGVAIDLHLDEVVAPAHRAELGDHFLVRTFDAPEIHVVGYLDVLALAHVGVHADGLCAVAEDLVALRGGDPPGERGALGADAGGDARFDLANPRRAPVPIGDPL